MPFEVLNYEIMTIRFDKIMHACRVYMPDLIGRKGEKALQEIGFTRQMVSMGHQASGALELFNYPMWLRDLVPQDPDGKERKDHVDLAALESESIIYPTVNLVELFY